MSDGGGHGGGKRRVPEEEHEEHENHERWLVSYADMMTLLMVLFIVMFAISQVDSKKFMALKTGLEAGFGAPLAMLNGADALLSVGGQVAPDTPNIAGVAGNKSQSLNDQVAKAAQMPDPGSSVTQNQVASLANALTQAQVKGQVSNLKQAEAQLKQALQVAGIAKGVNFRFDERGLVASIATDKVSFDSGSATLLPAGRRILDALAPTLLSLPNQLSIDGHTDSNPISTAQFPSNWQLGSARADGVLLYLATAHHFPYDRMSSSSFADTVPLVSGTSAAAMAADRRVEIVVLAQVDNSAGRAIAQLGNATSSAGTSGSNDTTDTSGLSTGTSSDASTPTPTAFPTPAHNLLGPDPTTSASASGSAATRRRTTP